MMAPATCPECGISIEAAALSCPGCHRLLHGAELQELAAQARAAAGRGDSAAERGFWERAIRLLPPETVQYRTIQARLAELDASPAPAAAHRPAWVKGALALGPLALILWNLKGLLLVVLTKGKVLLLGFTKLGTLLTMAASFGVYWNMYGWALALGLVLSIYIHEMGHVVALRQLGIPAGAPMFIPGIGAFVRLRALNVAPVDDNRIGLAGPLYGFGTALAALCVYSATQVKLWGVIAHFGAMINLFNLIPVWQLDGARGLRSLTKGQRQGLLAVTFVVWWITSEPMLLLVVMGMTYRMFTKDAAEKSDMRGLVHYAGLLVALAAVMLLSPVRTDAP